MTGHRAHVPALGDEHIGIDLLVIRHHKTKILVFLVKANDSLIGTLDHLDDRPFRTFPPGSRTCRDLHGVTMHGVLCLLRRNKHILVHAFYSHEAKALCMTAECSGQSEGLRLSILAAFGNSNLSFCHQGIQNLL